MPVLELNPNNPDLHALRQVIFDRLRQNPGRDQIPTDPIGEYGPYVQVVPAVANDKEVLGSAILEVFWQLVNEGVVTAGRGCGHSVAFPWFRVTDHGRRALNDQEYVPHDPRGYIELLRQRVPNPDPTVFAYLDESLKTFARDNLVASTVMLGVAAERVFDLVSDALFNALKDPAEQTKFSEARERMSMKPKVDWVHAKIKRLEEMKPKIVGLPEFSGLILTAIYDFIRRQRNDLGHPNDAPPRPSRPEAYANLLIFPPYYERAVTLIAFFNATKV